VFFYWFCSGFERDVFFYFVLMCFVSMCFVVSNRCNDGTGWRRLIGSPKWQIIVHKRATKYRALLRKMTCKDKGSYGSSPPCILLWCVLKVGLGISRTNADSEWNPVYNTFHRIFGCGNETIRRWFCKRDLDAANRRPALEQGCGKQTPGARKLFFRANLRYVPNIKM